MSKKWQHTDTAVDGTPLMLEDGKYYESHAWDHFGDAYRGEVRPVVSVKLWPPNRGKVSAWSPDEDTAEMEPFTFDLSDDAASKLLARVRDDPMTPEQVKKMREKVDAELARHQAAFNAWYFGKIKP